jgi:hypothetical protein
MNPTEVRVDVNDVDDDDGVEGPQTVSVSTNSEKESDAARLLTARSICIVLFLPLLFLGWSV